MCRDSVLICPRCEKPLAAHDDQACQRRMSRRYFFGLGLGALAGAIVTRESLAPSEIVHNAVAEPTLAEILRVLESIVASQIEQINTAVQKDISDYFLYGCQIGTGYINISNDGEPHFLTRDEVHVA